MISSKSNNNDSSRIISTVNNNQNQLVRTNNNNNYVTDLISNSINNRIIPKIGSIAKRFSLNYSGEGLVTDRERVRVVRVGIRFQVQVDSFVNRGGSGIAVGGGRPRAALRSTSSPPQLTDTDCSHTLTQNTTRALDCSPPPLNSTLSSNFLDRINALNNIRNSQASGGIDRGQHPSPYQQHFDHLREEQGDPSPPRENYNHHRRRDMEDSSSYQVLRHFPGSNVNSFRELNWETAAFEQQVRQWVQWLGDKASSSRLPPFIQPIVNSAKNYAKENPLSAITLLTLLATCALPIVGFLTFAVATILVTFIGFIFVEGAVLTVATVVLGGVLITVAFITLSVLVGGLVAYFFASQTFNLLRRHSTIVNILRRIPVIGHLVTNLDHAERNGSLHKTDQPGGYMENGGVRFGVGGKDLECDDNEEVDSIPYEIDEDHDDTYDYKANNASSPVNTNDDVPNEEILAHND